jgi:hypothetical protein
MPDYLTFQHELEGLINKHSLETRSNTPDFLLAAYLMQCLHAYEYLQLMRDGWHGRAPMIRNAVPLPASGPWSGGTSAVPRGTHIPSSPDDLAGPLPWDTDSTGGAP